MRIVSFIICTCWFILFSFEFISCRHNPIVDTLEPQNPNISTPIDTSSPIFGENKCHQDSIYYNLQVSPILTRYCATSSCHNQMVKSGNIDLSSYTSMFTSGIINPGDVAGSRLYQKITSISEPMPPSPYSRLSDNYIGILRQWIEQGARNTQCHGDSIIIAPEDTVTVVITPDEMNPCDSNTIFFEQQILPILINNCTQSGCHNAQDAPDDIILTNYNSIVETGEIVPFDPEKSELYEKITEDNPEDIMPPTPNPALSQNQIDLIKKWIDQGAKNNSCEDLLNCDTITVSYQSEILGIMNNNCVGCHGNNNPGGGLLLNSYSGIKNAANSGRLYGAVTGAPGYSPMPQDGNLTLCDIEKIKTWINSGSPNN